MPKDLLLTGPPLNPPDARNAWAAQDVAQAAWTPDDEQTQQQLNQEAEDLRRRYKVG